MTDVAVSLENQWAAVAGDREVGGPARIYLARYIAEYIAVDISELRYIELQTAGSNGCNVLVLIYRRATVKAPIRESRSSLRRSGR